MPRLFHRPPKYSLHKSTQQAVVSVSGKRIYLGPYGSKRSLQRYQEVIKDWEDTRHKQQRQAKRDQEFRTADDKPLATNLTAAQLREKRSVGAPISINELILVYHRYTHEYYRKNGEVTREAGVIDDALRILRKHCGLMSADDFGPVSLDTLRDAMIDERDWSRKYINKQVNRIRALFKWSTAKELVEPRVSQALRELPGLKKGRTRAREIAPVTVVADSVIDATLAKLPQVVADMVRVQRLTSARPGEICSMAPADIDRSGDVWIYRPVEHKTEHFERDRIVAIGPRAQQILAAYVTGREPQSYCFSPQESEALRRAVVTSLRKTPLTAGNRPGTNRVAAPKRQANARYTTASYRRAIHRACEKLKIDKWSPNRIRHTASTEIRKRFGIDAARAVDGHGAASTTEIYAELDLNKAVEVMREVG